LNTVVNNSPSRCSYTKGIVMADNRFNTSPQDNNIPSVFNLMAKPVGPICNLDCTYCFYKEKDWLLSELNEGCMSDLTLEEYIRQYIQSQSVEEVSFVWQGGEPTLAGLPFFRKAVILQKKYAGTKRILNSIQTNGTLLDDEWCLFLAEHNFLVGLSLDGPAHLHDRFRVNGKGKPTFECVMGALELLKKHGVEFNILASVTNESSKYPLDVYRFLKQAGAEFIQFIPIVEEADWSVDPEPYGDFLNRVFDEWIQNDVGRIVVMNFEWALHSWLGNEPPACQFSRICGMSMVLESNGDVYSCDHFVHPENLLGNIHNDGLKTIVGNQKQFLFGLSKEENLPRSCRDCQFLFACRGGCPKDRLTGPTAKETGRNRLCMGYRKFFEHVDEHMIAMSRLIAAGQPLSPVMNQTE